MCPAGSSAFLRRINSVKEIIMTISRNTFHANLFYSYSHKDAQYRDDMETALSLLKRNNLLKDWSDLKILPGQTIPKEVREKMDDANILVFLLSQDFIASDECMKEWEYAKQLAANGEPIFRIPIILRDCPWKDLLKNDNIKALPNDGVSVANFDNKDTAWMEVYDGIKTVINHLRKTRTSKSEPTMKVEKTNDLSIFGVDKSDSTEFMLLCSANGQVGFLSILEARRDSTSVSAKLLPESSQDISFLRSLRDNYSRRFGFAYQEDAAWGSIQEIVETTSGSQTVCEVILDIDNRNQGYGFFSDMAINGISSDEIANMRARRILLNEKLEDANPALSQINILEQLPLEIYIRGMSSSSHEPKLEVTESPIPQLYRQFGSTPERFKKFARLSSIFYLKLSHTIESVVQLDLELLGPTQLHVKFKGIRPKFYSNVEPEVIEFEGICSLSE